MSIALATLTLRLPDDAATRALGASLAKQLAPGWIVTLSGQLGAGKTTLVQGLLAALGETKRVRSPTYTLVESYSPPGWTVHHFDLYRFDHAADWNDAGLQDLIDEQAVALIEWPERAAEALPPSDLRIALAITERGREAQLVFDTPRAAATSPALKAAAGAYAQT
jgi:tRNA threonylcarbamoyladenosine biosynthesis protein TsaE